MGVEPRREHMQQIFGHPSAGPGCLVESKRREEPSTSFFVARLQRQSAWARIYPIEIYIYIYNEAQNRIHARNGETEQTKKEKSSLY